MTTRQPNPGEQPYHFSQFLIRGELSPDENAIDQSTFEQSLSLSVERYGSRLSAGLESPLYRPFDREETVASEVDYLSYEVIAAQPFGNSPSMHNCEAVNYPILPPAYASEIHVMPPTDCMSTA